MARVDPEPAFRGYQDEVWQLMHAGVPLGSVGDAIEQTDMAEPQKASLWLLAFSLCDPDEPYIGDTLDDVAPPVEAPPRRHLALVG